MLRGDPVIVLHVHLYEFVRNANIFLWAWHFNVYK